MRKVIIDTDTGSDDAVALVMALRDTSVKVLAITTVSGNVEVEQATVNALISIDHAGTYQPPVFKGMAKPLVSEYEPVSDIEGFDNFSDLGFKAPVQTIEEGHAVNGLTRIIAESDGDIELLTLGPLTNVAMAMIQAPDVIKKIPRITIMGGAHFYSNAHSAMAEYNIMADPEAADVVFRFGVPITMVTIEACQAHSAPLNSDEIAKFQTSGRTAKFCMDCNKLILDIMKETIGGLRLELPDAVAYAVFSRPELAKTSFNSQTIIELGGVFSRGTTIFRTRVGFFETAPQEINSKVITEVDGHAFKEFMYALVKE